MSGLWQIATFCSLIFTYPAMANDAPRIIFLGDSLTAGYQLNPQVAFPALLEAELREKGFDGEVVNAGISGDTSAGGARRIDWLLRRPVDILVLALGANDALRGQSPDAMKNNLESIMEKTRAANPAVQILLVGMLAPPNLGAEYGRAYEKVFQELSNAQGVTFFPFLLKDVAGLRNLNLPDGIHPNEAGHRIIAQNLLPYLWPLVSAVDD